MNNGKICVSVCAATADEMIAKIKEADPLADVIEVRFDCLDKDEFDYEHYKTAGQVHSRIISAGDRDRLLTTFRPADQGGRRTLSELERDNFWGGGCETEYVDLEIDQLANSEYWLWGTRICSFHDFEGVYRDLDVIFEKLANPIADPNGGPPDVIKIAVRSDDITDAIPVWNLLDRAKRENKQIIPIAMGEAGKWTRILGLAHGAYMTYASLDAGDETAPGQVTVEDMTGIYRVRELGPGTKVYGIVGNPVSQSLSPYMQNPAFAAAGVDAVFIPLPVRDLDEFMRRMVRRKTREVELNFGGFSVTMPHKQAIMKHLDRIDPVAEKIGAVNTVLVDDDGGLTGYNTDAYGFITPLKAKYGDLKGARVAMCGAGGAARACVYALKQDGADIVVFARDAQKAEAFGTEFGIRSGEITDAVVNEFDIVVDATPHGMKGELESTSLFTADQLDGVKFVYDLVTRGAATPILDLAANAGIPAIGGVEMLIAQGTMQFKIWTNREAPADIMRQSVMARLKE